MSKVIFDFGAHKGQNITYYLNRADYLVCVEANPILCKNIKIDFRQYINEGRLFVENFALSNQKLSSEKFYIHKTKSTHSQLLKPTEPSNFNEISVPTMKASTLIKNYLNKFKLEKAHYIKIDIEYMDHIVLHDILKFKIKFDYISCECHSSNVLKELISSDIKFFKIILGRNVANQSYINKNNTETKFLHHSSGPFGNDINQKWMNKTSLITYIVNNGFTWQDISCSALEEKNISQELVYDSNTHKPLQMGFNFHLKRLIPSFFNSLKKRINETIR